MRSIMMLAVLALTLVIGRAAPVAAFAPGAGAMLKSTGSAEAVAYFHRRHYNHGRVPRYLRGFDDPGYAYHGNINGCAEDLGYGRWESCNTGR